MYTTAKSSIALIALLTLNTSCYAQWDPNYVTCQVKYISTSGGSNRCTKINNDMSSRAVCVTTNVKNFIPYVDDGSYYNVFVDIYPLPPRPFNRDTGLSFQSPVTIYTNQGTFRWEVLEGRIETTPGVHGISPRLFKKFPNVSISGKIDIVVEDVYAPYIPKSQSLCPASIITDFANSDDDQLTVENHEVITTIGEFTWSTSKITTAPAVALQPFTSNTEVELTGIRHTSVEVTPKVLYITGAVNKEITEKISITMKNSTNHVPGRLSMTIIPNTQNNAPKAKIVFAGENGTTSKVLDYGQVEFEKIEDIELKITGHQPGTGQIGIVQLTHALL